MVNFRVIAADHQIVAARCAGKFKNVSRVSAMIRARSNEFAAAASFNSCAVRKFESFDSDASGVTFDLETNRAGNFRATNSFGGNDNWLSRRSSLRNDDGVRRSVNTVGDYDVCAGFCRMNGRLQFVERGNFNVHSGKS